MWRNAIAVLGVLVSGAANAQQSLEDALPQLQVFDCVLGDAQTIYVFQKGPDGALALVGDADAPVRMGEKGISLMTATDAREIGDGVYNVYKDGAAETGTCSDATALAHVIYPALTAAYAPDAAGDTVEEQAAAAALQDLEVRVVDAENRANEAAKALETTTAALQAAETERDDLRLLTEQQSTTIATTKVELDTVKASYTETITLLNAERSNGETLTAKVETLTSDLAAATEAHDMAKTIGSETAAKLATTESDLAELRTLHQAVMAAADEFKVQLNDTLLKLSETTVKLDGAEQSGRSLVATVAGLNQKITNLGAELETVRGSVDAANKKAADANARARSVAGLTDAAIARVATLQGRSQNAIRSELCRFIGRNANCGR